LDNVIKSALTELKSDLTTFQGPAFKTPAVKSKRASKISPSNAAAKGKGLQGRGLRGAGVSAVAAEVKPKRTRAYNLADIEGSGKASDLKYKRIGTKFIRKADLNSNRLKLVYPNRTSVGPIRSMSDALTAMIKDLLYNDNISQQSYRAMSIDDQRVFHEVVKKTHIDHTLMEPMVDPRYALRAEFDKLRGELALGNDNPDMLRELQRLSIDIYAQKLISDSEFKKLMSAMI
jgi:hypothetical protein